MNFVDNIIIYFTQLLDITLYLTFLFFVAGLTILDWPKKITTKNVLLTLLKGLITYAIIIGFEGIMFGLIGGSNTYGGILFSASFAVVPLFYLIFFIKGPILPRIVKYETVIATVLTIGQFVTELNHITRDLPENIMFIAYILRVVPYGFCIFSALVVRKYDLCRFKNITKAQLGLITILTVSMSLASIFQSILMEADTVVHIFLSIVEAASLVVLTHLYFTMYSVIEKRHTITTLEVQSSILTLEKESLLIDEKNREELMKIRHDLKNQLSYVNVLLNEGKYDEAKQYLYGLLEQKENYLESFSCPNVVISGIVNLKLTKAKIAGKKIKFRAVVPPRLPFEDSDLLSLITNIADNCLENFVPKDDKDRISISILTQQDYLRIVSYNTVTNVNIEEGKLSLHTSKEAKNHGYGTKIIKNICEKYHGYATFAVDGDQFVCDCVLDMTYRSQDNA